MRQTIIVLTSIALVFYVGACTTTRQVVVQQTVLVPAPTPPSAYTPPQVLNLVKAWQLICPPEGCESDKPPTPPAGRDFSYFQSLGEEMNANALYECWDRVKKTGGNATWSTPVLQGPGRWEVSAYWLCGTEPLKGDGGAAITLTWTFYESGPRLLPSNRNAGLFYGLR